MPTTALVPALTRYDALVIMTPTADVEGAEKVSQQLTHMIEQLGGKIEKIEPAGRRRLAVTIGRNAEGLVLSVLFQLPPEKVATLQRQVRLTDNILRVTLVKADESYEAEKHAMITVVSARENRTPESMAARIAEMREQGISYGGDRRGGRFGDRGRGGAGNRFAQQAYVQRDRMAMAEERAASAPRLTDATPSVEVSAE
ncbi:MAG: 30S ribosomal protein S6 [Vampirovibrionales bacterium]|nr:30S ribosomal protein S6 [Vampirovibrionales bacterium]